LQMASAALLFQEVFLRLSNIEKQIEVIKESQPAPVQPQPQIDIEPLKTQLNVISNRLNNHIESYNDVKKIMENTLLLKAKNLVNKQIQEYFKNKNESSTQESFTIIPDIPLVGNDLTIEPPLQAPISAQAPVSAPAPAVAPQPTHSKKKDKKAITLNLE